MKWIPASERMPDKGVNENYLVKHSCGVEANRYWNGIGFINFETSTWNYFTDIIGWYDPAPPATSIKDEALKEYPDVDESTDYASDDYRINEVRKFQRSAYIAGRSVNEGEVARLKAENVNADERESILIECLTIIKGVLTRPITNEQDARCNFEEIAEAIEQAHKEYNIN